MIKVFVGFICLAWGAILMGDFFVPPLGPWIDLFLAAAFILTGLTYLWRQIALNRVRRDATRQP